MPGALRILDGGVLIAMDHVLTTLMAFSSQHWAILIVGLGVTLAAFVIGHRVIRAAHDGKDSQTQKALENLSIQTNKERRADQRREGNPIEVELSDVSGRIKTTVGWVSDRSRGGIGLEVEIEIPPGTILKARPRSGITRIP